MAAKSVWIGHQIRVPAQNSADMFFMVYGHYASSTEKNWTKFC
jgi:hypothetical protein